MNRVLILLVSLSFVSAGLTVAADEKGKVATNKLPPPAVGTMDFVRDIKPIFAEKCVSCHGAAKQRGGLRLDDSTEALKGGNSGASIKQGDSLSSKLIHLVGGLDPELAMPPKGKPPVSVAELSRLRAWIDQGAKWPREAPATIQTTAKLNHWAYQAIQRPALPPVRNSSWVRNEIDRFVLARLEAEKIAPSPEADKITLMRRLYLDLLGLLPAPAEVDAFLQDSRSDAYEHLVDRVLTSPHYGERWGRHWLDLARYADSDGYEKDTGRPFAWRWRQWVIEALNRDLPFDQFTLEQLAGDLLPNATLEQKIATGFHRNTLTNREGGVDREQFRVEAVVDRVNTTGKVFLGQTIGCCQCHDHKYDPFSQREYYQFFAYFDSDVEVDLPAPQASEIDSYQKKKAAHDQKRAQLQGAVAEYQKTALEKWEHEMKLPELRQLPTSISAILLSDSKKRSDAQKKELSAYFVKSKTDPKLTALTKAVTDHDKNAPKMTQAQTLALGAPRKTHIMIRGDFLRPGVEVEPATPAVLPKWTTTGKPTRLDLAKWIVDPANPLTARVISNWVWHHYFGRGLVATLEDFGTQGEKPSHPELLDYLATEFVRQKWSLKSLHKFIVQSATYRQSSRTRPELQSRDPINVLLARQSRSRMEAEVIRDVTLDASGLLTRTVGGPSVRPPQPAGISELTYAGSARWVESTGADRYRRGLYTWFQRTSPYPMLMTFDAPDSNISCVRRERSNTPLQALTLLNDTTFFECAQALGLRVVREKLGPPQERIRHAFRLCLIREPSDQEQRVLGRLYEDLLASCNAKPDVTTRLLGTAKPTGASPAEAAAWIALARTILNLDEFVTRE